ncbi:MAG: hypothetical protein ACFCVC_19940 [Acidimicrobiia bacterium]
MMSRRSLGWVILVWTAISWGGRLSLLTDVDADDLWSWARIGGSFVIGLVAGLALIIGKGARPMAIVFALWTIPIWARSLFMVWTEPNTTGFRLVHTALAVVWLALSAWALRWAQATGSGKGASPTGVPGSTSSANRDTTSSIDR